MPGGDGGSAGGHTDLRQTCCVFGVNVDFVVCLQRLKGQKLNDILVVVVLFFFQ